MTERRTFKVEPSLARVEGGWKQNAERFGNQSFGNLPSRMVNEENLLEPRQSTQRRQGRSVRKRHLLVDPHVHLFRQIFSQLVKTAVHPPSPRLADIRWVRASSPSCSHSIPTHPQLYSSEREKTRGQTSETQRNPRSECNRDVFVRY